MSILSTNKIIDRQLWVRKFHKSNKWGAPSNWGETTVHWYKDIVVQTGGRYPIEYNVMMFYFPNNFNGYVTPFNIRGMNPADRVMFICDDNDSLDRIYSIEIRDCTDLDVVLADYEMWFKKKSKR